MSYAPITRAGVDEAEALDFTEKRITLSATVSWRGRQITITAEGYTLDQFADLLDRRVGGQPDGKEHSAPSCPIHQKPMRQGKGGWFCPTKLSDDTWCKHRA